MRGDQFVPVEGTYISLARDLVPGQRFQSDTSALCDIRSSGQFFWFQCNPDRGRNLVVAHELPAVVEVDPVMLAKVVLDAEGNDRATLTNSVDRARLLDIAGASGLVGHP